jgi:hypothetical protein
MVPANADAVFDLNVTVETNTNSLALDPAGPPNNAAVYPVPITYPPVYTCVPEGLPVGVFPNFCSVGVASSGR